MTLARDFFVMGEGGGISLVFNPNVLQVLSVTLNSAVWEFVNQQGVINKANRSTSDILFSSYREVADDAVVAIISFKARAQGQSSLTMTESQMNPFADGGERIAPGFQKGRINVKKKTWGGYEMA